MTMHGETGVRVLGFESQLALAHADEPTAVLLARYREILLKPFDELRRDYEALGDHRVARHLDSLLCMARGIDWPRRRQLTEPLLTPEELAAIAAMLRKDQT